MLGIGAALGRILDKFFSLENLIKIVESFGIPIPDAFMKQAAEDRIKNKQKQIETLDKQDVVLQKRIDQAQIDLAAEQAKETKGEEVCYWSPRENSSQRDKRI